MEILQIILFLIVIVIAFILGKHWDVTVIKEELKEQGYSIRRYGEKKNHFVKIIGTCEDISQSST